MPEYHAIVHENAIQTTQNGTPSVAIKVRTDDGKFFIGHLWLTEKAAKRTMETLRNVFFFTGDSLNDLREPILSGRQCQITTEFEEYNGKSYEKISFFNPVGGGGQSLKAVDEMALASISAKFDAMLIGTPKNEQLPF